MSRRKKNDITANAPTTDTETVVESIDIATPKRTRKSTTKKASKPTAKTDISVLNTAFTPLLDVWASIRSKQTNNSYDELSEAEQIMTGLTMMKEALSEFQHWMTDRMMSSYDIKELDKIGLEATDNRRVFIQTAQYAYGSEMLIVLYNMMKGITENLGECLFDKDPTHQADDLFNALSTAYSDIYSVGGEKAVKNGNHTNKAVLSEIITAKDKPNGIIPSDNHRVVEINQKIAVPTTQESVLYDFVSGSFVTQVHGNANADNDDTKKK